MAHVSITPVVKRERIRRSRTRTCFGCFQPRGCSTPNMIHLIQERLPNKINDDVLETTAPHTQSKARYDEACTCIMAGIAICYLSTSWAAGDSVAATGSQQPLSKAKSPALVFVSRKMSSVPALIALGEDSRMIVQSKLHMGMSNQLSLGFLPLLCTSLDAHVRNIDCDVFSLVLPYHRNPSLPRPRRFER